MNHSPQATRARFLLLCEKSRDASLSPAETDELNTLLASHADLVTLMAESLLVDAELRRDPRLLDEMKLTPAKREAPRNVIPMVALAAAACVFLGLFIFQTTRRPAATKPAGVAVLTKSTNCKWASSTLPTAEGSHVPAGKLELVEGLATILFDSGAEISLEAPATLEILDRMNARLVSGTLVADVPPSAIGFTIDTKDAKVVDLGTRFGLSTNDEGKYLVQVIEGLVEVEHKGEEGVKLLTTGKTIDRGLLQTKLHPENSASEPTRWQPYPSYVQADGWQNITTSYGRGKDTFVTSRKEAADFGSEAFFRVKYTTRQADLVRVGFLGFDISQIDTGAISEAELVLNIEPSDLGYATLVGDSEFTVYGLTDEAGDAWSESGMKWENAPALDSTMAEVARPDPAKSVRLGSFGIPQGVQRGTCSVSGADLAAFIREDGNEIVTLMVFRETDESANSGLVHAFTSKENATNPPPLLRVKTE